jgi:hypothetical protein
MASAEFDYLRRYLKARRDARAGLGLPAQMALLDLIHCLPVLLAGSPSEAFCATLALLPEGGVRADLLLVLPAAHADHAYALVGTAIDTIHAIHAQATALSRALQSKLQEPVHYA